MKRYRVHWRSEGDEDYTAPNEEAAVQKFREDKEMQAEIVSCCQVSWVRCVGTHAPEDTSIDFIQKLNKDQLLILARRVIGPQISGIRRTSASSCICFTKYKRNSFRQINFYDFYFDCDMTISDEDYDRVQAGYRQFLYTCFGDDYYQYLKHYLKVHPEEEKDYGKCFEGTLLCPVQRRN